MAETITNIPKATLLAYLRNLLNDANGLSYSDTEINNWIDYASADISKITRLVEVEKFISLVTNTVEYTNPLNEISSATTGPYPTRSAMGIYGAEYLGTGNTITIAATGTTLCPLNLEYGTGGSYVDVEIATGEAVTYGIPALVTRINAAIAASGAQPTGAAGIACKYVPSKQKFQFYSIDGTTEIGLDFSDSSDTVSNAALCAFMGVTGDHKTVDSFESDTLCATNTGFDRSSSMSLISINPKQVKNAMDSTSGKPQYYYEYGDKIGIYPKPSSTYNTHIVGIKGYQSISAYSYSFASTTETTEDRWELPYMLAPIIIFKALSYAKLKYNKYDQSAQYENIFNALSVFARQDLSDRKFDSKYDVMKIADNTVIQQ